MICKTTSLAAAFLLLALAPASAAANRTFVSGSGSDTNPCTITQPCRSLQAAVNATAPAGEVVILTPGGYGTVTITQSITIANDGVGTTSISVPSQGTGITINAGSSDVVQLRGLEIDGNEVGNIGVSANSGRVDIRNCVIRHFLVAGVATTSTAPLTVRNTVIADNAAGLYLQVAPSSIEDSDIINNSDYGLYVFAGDSNVKRCRISGSTNSQYGGVVSQHANVFITETSITNNINGVYVDQSGTVYIDRNTIISNGTGLNNDGGYIYTLSNNDVSKNSANISGTVTPISGQ